ncbi:ABC transporter ATP-binding protein [Nocardioides limicola]|uniref:ABC transporter ATP-binding protein n=1 Tax=Nocardioides limicola TaxID=2803368 RepID=UPI00193C6232|nr:ABC transporter ATP-binding protein [Nocardioides sp. DJM-14]
MTTPSAPALSAIGLGVGYGSRLVAADLHLHVDAGSWVALVGRNGCGKSTVLRALSRLMPARSGQILLDGQAISSLPTREIARRMAVLPQGPQPPAGITVRELVELGRHPHRALLGPLSAADREAVEDAMNLTGTAEYAHRYVDRLSGGERQRVWLALALAQQTDLLLLDEPTTFLDIGHQLEVLDLVARLRAARGLTVVTVLHDLGHAARYADRMVILDEGRILADGRPEQVVTPELVRRAFGVEATVLTDPVTGTPVVLPHTPASSPHVPQVVRS